MNPWLASGLVAAAYDLGLMHLLAPKVFTDPKGFDPRTGILAGIGGYGLGTLEQNQLKEHLAAAQAELQRSETRRTHEHLYAQGREAALRHQLEVEHQQAQMNQILRAVFEAKGTTGGNVGALRR